VISYGPAARQRWSGAEVGRQAASRKPFRSPPSAAESRIAELERLLGRNNWSWIFQTSLRTSQGAAANRTSDGGKGSIAASKPRSRSKGRTTVGEQCQLAEVSLSGFYRYLQQSTPVQADLLLRARLQELAVEHRRLRGYRLLTRKLRREGQVVNHKRVLRLMREDNLLCLRRTKYVFTTDSRHDLPIYPNLARRVALTALNQLWVADITYIRLRNEFIYLAVVLDAYSRRVIGWELGRSLQVELAIGALQMALTGRNWNAGELIHHSDQGVQYARIHADTEAARDSDQHESSR
jgi:hypothetical protein